MGVRRLPRLIHHYGRPIVTRIKRVRASIAVLAGHAEVIGAHMNGTKKIRVKDGPHICAKRLTPSGVGMAEAAGRPCMRCETLRDRAVIITHFRQHAANASRKAVTWEISGEHAGGV